MIEPETYLRFVAPLVLVAVVSAAVGVLRLFGYFEFKPSERSNKSKP